MVFYRKILNHYPVSYTDDAEYPSHHHFRDLLPSLAHSNVVSHVVSPAYILVRICLQIFAIHYFIET